MLFGSWPLTPLHRAQNIPSCVKQSARFNCLRLTVSVVHQNRSLHLVLFQVLPYDFRFERVKHHRLSFTISQFKGEMKVNSLPLVPMFHRTNTWCFTVSYFHICMTHFLRWDVLIDIFVPLIVHFALLFLSFFFPPFQFRLSKVILYEKHGKLKALYIFVYFCNFFFFHL